MALAFKCDSCQQTITVRLLKPGEIAECKTCGAKVVVPTNANEVAETSRDSSPKGTIRSNEDEPPWTFGSIMDRVFPVDGVGKREIVYRVIWMVLGTVIDGISEYILSFFSL